MKEKIFDDGNLVILKRGVRYFLRYDAGAHQVAIREDEISRAETNLIMQNELDGTKVLIAIQKRLCAAGVNPSVSNID